MICINKNRERTMKMNSVLWAASLSLAGAGMAQAETVRIPINEWTGQHISAHITGTLLEKAGHDVEYVTAGAVPQFAAIANGDLHLQPEVWTNNVGDIYPKAVESGDITVVGQLGLQPQEGWIYPPYMAEKCPGLPDYQALYDCAQAFAAADTFPKGRLITYPADWGTRSKDVVAMIDMPFEPVAGGSEGAMIAELKSATATQDPILMMFWQPHWLFADMEMEWVAWDPADGECVEEEGQERGKACGFQQASIDKIINAEFAEANPSVAAVFEQISIDNEVQNALMLEIDQKGRDLEEVVAEWIDANEETWGPWVEAGRAAQ
ncbi:glycine/betaine ABC transporter substrate-binding protein [Roseovarius atlanticus]|uniref:Glycine/betaine ABC transporter substrate-binding protein n=2 Tax=Roseovarius atlanticus TaxID=1641875 RepID=A0A0T5NS44_9RHOB|nr:glycine/betaine ABC transporter substrate-binding protein [Roseovarius atlanticus]